VSSISLRRITKSFGKTRVLEGVDLEVAQGEVVALLGPSGCGKSTLVRIVAGLEQADQGEVWLGQRQVDGGGASVPPEGRRLGMVFQSYAVWPHRTVAQNVAYPLTLQRAPAEQVAARVARALELVHLTGLDARFPHELSGGQQQRVALARALVAEPEVLLLDEPLSNLDARLREEMRRELAELSARLDITVLLVTHDQAEALAIADRVAVMRKGRIAQLGAPEDTYRRPSSLYVAEALGPLNVLPIEGLEAAGAGLRVRSAGGLVVEVEGVPDARAETHVLAVRPEAFVIDAAGTGQGHVLSSTFLGERRELSCTLGAVTLRIAAATAVRAKAGEVVRLSVREALLLPKAE
jgi:iron(III) transport system ATP-binding protein